MPFTPFHWGPSSWVGLLCFRFISLFAFLVGSVIVDVEPLLVLVFNLNYPLHGFFHSFLGGTIAAILLSGVLYRFRAAINKLMRFFKLAQESSYKTILFSCLLGVYFHIFLDSFLYTDIKPFFPLTTNPFYALISLPVIYLLCGASFLLGILLYGVKISRGKVKKLLKVICILSFVVFIIITTGLITLSLTRSPFDDGPFIGTTYTQSIEGKPDSTVKLGNKYILEAYNRKQNTPVLALRGKDGVLLWSKLLTVSNVENFENCKVGELHLANGWKTFNGYHVKGWVRWTYGAEAANFYLSKDGDLKEFYLSW